MIPRLSTYITNFFINSEIISCDERSIYQYGTEVTISSILGYALILVLGLILKSFNYSIIFLLCFVSIRIYTGGYHADTYMKCNIIFFGLYLFFIMFVKNIPQSSNFKLSLVLSCLSLIIIITFSPIENKNKPFYGNERKRYKKLSIYISIVWLLISLILLYFNINILTSVSIIFVIIAFLMLLEKIKYKGANQNEKKY